MHTVSEAESEESYNSNDDIGRDWYHWCRICAKADIKNVNIFIKDEDVVITDGTTDYNSSQISMAIGKYFEVEMKHEEQLPMELCTDCLLMIISLINFNKRVIKVQQMYIALQQLNGNAAKNLEDFRLKYGAFENDEPHHFTYGSAGEDFQLFVEKREIEQPEEVQEALIDELPDETCAAFEIKIEKHHDFTPLMSDGDFCDFEMLGESFDSDCVFNKNDDGGYDISDENSSQININDETNSETILTDISQTNVQHSTNKAKNATKNIKRKRTTQSANSSAKHLKYDSENDDKDDDDSYYCVECCKAFKTFGYYRSHMEREHAQTTVESRYTCSDCTLSFNTRNKLDYHRYQKHTPLTLRQKFKCSYCDQQLTTKTALEQHIRFVHRHERPVICEECGIGVRTKSELIKHMLTHSDYAAFECEICKKRFKSRERLKKHNRTHSPTRHICTKCGLQLKSQTTLNNHLLVHSDVKPHKCDYCEKTFKRTKELKNHLILHTGLKLYSCDFCEKTFAGASNMRAHKKVKHPKEVAAADASGEKMYAKNIPKLEVLKSV